MLTMGRDCEPLTPEDIAETIVFCAGRRENVVIADMLVYPSHQVRFVAPLINSMLTVARAERGHYTRSRRRHDTDNSQLEESLGLYIDGL